MAREEENSRNPNISCSIDTSNVSCPPLMPLDLNQTHVKKCRWTCGSKKQLRNQARTAHMKENKQKL